MTPAGKPWLGSASGSTIDSSTIASSWPGITSSRSGPTVPPLSAAAKVWQAPQPLLAKTWPPGPPGASGGAIPGTPATDAT